MEPINIMFNGIPGNVAATIAAHIAVDPRFNLLPFSMTGPEIDQKQYTIKSMGKNIGQMGERVMAIDKSVDITLVKPDERDNTIIQIIQRFPQIIAVDFTHPAAVNGNAEFYAKFNIPFVMGTTGGDRGALNKTVLSSSISAVIAPNMAKQIVGFQAMMEYAAETFPDLFKGYTLQIKESHQNGKADTSGTAKAMVKYYNKLGIPFKEDDIIMDRDPEIQKNRWNIPEQYLSGHAWHTYTLTSDNDSAKFEFSHNINGRDIYAQGTIDAILFLHSRIKNRVDGSILLDSSNDNKNMNRGIVYTMIDVLKGNRI